MDFPIVLDNKLLPLQAFFNAVPARSLIKILEGFSKGVGAGFNDVVCEFPDELDEGEEKFAGIKFYIFNEELVVSNVVFFCCLQDVCRLYVEKNPADRAIVDRALENVAIKLEVHK